MPFEPLAFDAYVECALWASTHPDTEMFLDDNYGPEDIAPEARATMLSDVSDFITCCEGEGITRATFVLAQVTPEQLGHDFWLTRNRHGAGFWDRSYPPEYATLGDRLTVLAHSFGSCDILPGDDGKLYVS